MSALRRTNSIVIGGQIPAVAIETLRKLGVSSEVGSKDEYSVVFKLKSAAGTDAVFGLARALIENACQSSVGVVTRPEGEVTVDLTDTANVKNYSFANIVKKSGVTFDDLPSDAGVAAIAELTYLRCLNKTFGTSYGIVSAFPPVLRGADVSNRVDFFIGGTLLLQVVGSVLKIFVKNVENLLGRMPKSTFVEDTLGLNFKEFSTAPEKFAVGMVPDLLAAVSDAIIEYWQDAEDQQGHRGERAKAYVTFLMAHVSNELRKFIEAKASASSMALSANAPARHGLSSSPRRSSSSLLDASGHLSQSSLNLAGGHTSLFRIDKKHLQAYKDLLDDWAATCAKMCRIDFGRLPFSDPPLERFRLRVEAIMHLRDLNDEIMLLVDPNEAARGGSSVSSLWDAFDSIDTFDVSPATDDRWEQCTAMCNRRLEPLEHLCADKLRALFAARGSVAPQVTMNEFMRFRHIVNRPIVARELEKEREVRMTHLNGRVHEMRVEYDHNKQSYDIGSSGSGGGGGQQEDQIGGGSGGEKKYPTGRFLPPVVNKLVWARQLHTRLGQMLNMCKMMLSDLRRAASFTEQCEKLRTDLEELMDETLRDWIADVEMSRELQLNAEQPVLFLDSKGMLQINYPERLVQLIREVRVLTSMGCKISPRVMQIAATASRFYPAGIQLKQLATSFNSVNDDVIESTRLLLEGAGKEMDRVVRGSGVSGMVWSNVNQTNRFIEQLRRAVALVLDDNRRLHRLHHQMGLLVVELFSIDLLRNKERWLGKVRTMSDKVLHSGFPRENMGPWLRHWDAQIYKALEFQWKLGLESLHEELPEVKADIVYDSKRGCAALRPPFHVVREQYYSKLRDFVAFPTRFQGIGGNNFFSRLVGYNEHSLMSVAKHSAHLFERVEAEVNRFAPLLLLGRCGMPRDPSEMPPGAMPETYINENPTMEEICKAALKDPHHWEQSIRLLKSKGRDLNDIPTFIKIDCITLSTVGVRSAVEEQLARMGATLNSTLRDSAQEHLSTINAFLDETQSSLETEFTKVDDLNRASVINAELNMKRPRYQGEFHNFHEKNKLYISLTGSAGIPHKEAKVRWDKMTQRLDSFETEMQTRMEQLKGNVSSSLGEFWKNFERFQAIWNERKPTDPTAVDGSKFVTAKAAEFKDIMSRSNELRAQCKYFELDEPDFSGISEIDEDITAFAQMWTLMDAFNGDLASLRSEPWMGIRNKMYRFEEFLKTWTDKLRDVAKTTVSTHVRTLLDQWTRAMPLFKYVRGDGFTPQHWKDLFGMMRIKTTASGAEAITPDLLVFSQILDAVDEIVSNEKAIKKLHARAEAEAQIRRALDEVRAWGKTSCFKLQPHTDRANVQLITDWKETIDELNDKMALLLSMKDSPYFQPFADDAAIWERKLATLDEYLLALAQIQRKWIYLEPIFSRGALPQEQPRFERTDRDLLSIYGGIARDPLVMSFAGHAEYKEKLKRCLEELDMCQKALNEFLEKKRDKFPRFYFISDDDLLEILGQSRNVSVIQTHLKKLFAGISTVHFDQDKKFIIRVASAEGEQVTVAERVEIKAEVEDWLTVLDRVMKATLQRNMNNCFDKLEIANYPSQVLNLSEQIHFAEDTEKAIRADGSSSGGAGGNMSNLRSHRANLKKQLGELTTFAATNSDHVLDLKLKSLVMDLIHSIEVVDLLIENHVRDTKEWLWRKQLRYYMDRARNATIQMVDADFAYTWEYQGNGAKLVHTPLTDKCFLTITQGMHLGYGTNAQGPAGTGKTESVKQLAALFGRCCLVFCCDESFDFSAMGRIFTGLCNSGSWGCFDEFNRLKVDQLSAVSQMIQGIQEALKTKESTCILMKRRIAVDPAAGIFVTMNPAGKKYGGRSKLPDNLKQLFRTVAMSVPDSKLITETILYSEGFEHAADLSTRVVEVFRLSNQLLSAQQHYDWGLRAQKAVLRLAGKLVHDHLKEVAAAGAGSKPSSEEMLRIESEILIKSLRVNTLSKLTFFDVKLFNGLISDIFPGVNVNEIQYTELKPAILQSVKDLKLQLSNAQVDKILQLYEALSQRIGVVLVGPSGSGKSTALKVLRLALQKMGHRVEQRTVNPKALPREALLGKMDPDTREYQDGVLTEAAKQAVKEDLKTKTWIVCDGDVDPEWCEALNSVLDDNRLMTMPNGVRIQFGMNVNFVFETHSLQFASPATVSRLGMIFLSAEDVDPKMKIATWLAEQPSEVADKLKGLIDEYFFKAVDYIETSKAAVVDTTRMGLVLSALSQLKGCTTKGQFATALVFGLGSYLPESQRGDFALFVYGPQMCGERVPDAKRPLDAWYNAGRGSLDLLKYEQSFDLTIQELQAGPLVRTVDAQRAMLIMEQWVNPPEDPVAVPLGGFADADAAAAAAAAKKKMKKDEDRYLRPFILVGPEGCGKSMLLRHAFAAVTGTKIATIHCSAQTTSAHVIRKLQQSCQLFNSTTGKVLRPKDADRLVLLLKDLNLPKPDKYATVQLHSFLQQLISHGGYYDEHREWVVVKGVQIVGSMNPPGTSGRFPVASRLMSVVSVLSLSYPTKESLQMIYENFFNALLAAPVMQQIPLGAGGKSAADCAERFSRVLVHVYDGVFAKYTVDAASHYVFNPRDLTRWVLSALHYSPGGASLLDILVYESARIFGDRITAVAERAKFESSVQDQFVSLGWQKPGDKAAAAAGAAGGAGAPSSSDKSSSKEKPEMMYVAWLESTAAKTAKLSVAKPDDIKKQMEKMMHNYAREYPELDLLLIPETVLWLARIDRILATPGGCPLLIARAGVGANQMIRLASFLLSLPLYTLYMTRGYTIKQFKNDIKPAIIDAGINGQSCVLFLEDYMFVNPAFLEMINSLLAAGEIPGLFTPEELEPQLGPLKEDALSEGFTDGVYAYFAARVSRNLHVSIAMDSTHPDYEMRCRANPALFTKCSVCWIGGWTTEGMKHVPKHFLKDVFRSMEAKQKSQAADGAATAAASSDASSSSASASKFAKDFITLHDNHNSGECSPLQLQTLLMTYKEIYNSKSSASDETLAKLKKGLSKLAEAEANVESISKDVAAKKVEMQAKEADAEEALTEIKKKMAEAADQQKHVEKLTVESAQDEEQANKQKAVVQGKLSRIQPLIDEAAESLKQIKSGDIAELKGFKTASPAVVDVLDTVFVLLERSNGGLQWPEIKKLFAELGGTGPLLNFDPKGISPALRTKVEKMMQQKEKSFEKTVIERASKACAPMAAWVKANIEYSMVYEQVAPMHRDLEKLDAKLAKVNEKKKKYQDKIASIDEKVAKMRVTFEAKTTEAVKLKDKLAKAQQTLDRAQELLTKLLGEKTRWTKQMAIIQKDMDLVPKRALLAAACMTYLGKEPEDRRRHFIQQWSQELKVDSFSFFKFLRAESTQLLFKSQGLPSDELSMDNSLMILDQVRTPLVIDPAGQAVEWFKRNLKDRDIKGVETCTPADERFMNILDRCLRFGKTLLVCEVDKIDPVLYPLLRREFRVDGTKREVQLGDKDKISNFTDGFQLVLFTRSTDLVLPPDIADSVTQISFTVTRAGLEGQLLGITIQHEQPQLETQKMTILKEEDDLKMQLEKLEDQLLADLSAAQGSLLENTTLIESLNKIKTQAQSIGDALDKSKHVSATIDSEREVYRPLAERGSRILFLIRDLKALSHMYQFSLATFLDLFNRALEAGSAATADKKGDGKSNNTNNNAFSAAMASSFGNVTDVNSKIEALGRKLVNLVVVAVSRSLFKADRVTFGFHLAKGLAEPEAVSAAEWDFFLDRTVAPDSNKKDPVPSWVPNDALETFKAMRAAFPDLMRNLNLHETDAWYQWLRSPAPEADKPAFLARASPFQRVLVVKALRPDRLIAAMGLWACDSLHVPSLSDSSPITALLPLTTNSRPILLLTTPGADPSAELQAAAYGVAGRDKFHEIAMGGGQAEEAMRLVKLAAEEGHWCFLKNLHLVVDWVGVLEQELNLLTPKEGFRLWLTSEPHDQFPSILLSQSFKVTFEAPPGIKQNLLRSYGLPWFDQYVANSKSPTQAQLLFSLSVMHATMVERRSYVPQGWAKTYEFSNADLKSAADVILAQTGKTEKDIDWASIHGILENAIYGGKMETDFDVRILRKYLDHFFSDGALPSGGKTGAAQHSLIAATTPSLKVPVQCSSKEFIGIAEGLANSDIPAMFRLPPNADRVVQGTAVATCVGDLRKLTASRSAAKMTREEWISAITPILNTWMSLCQSHADLLSSHGSQGKRDSNPVNGFVGAEVDASIALMAQVQGTMDALRRVTEGTALLTDQLRAASYTMIADGVPLAWDNHFVGPESITPWLKCLVRKAAAIRKWFTEVEKAGGEGTSPLLKTKLDLGDLFRPQTFLNALRQETARHTREPLVSLELVSSLQNPPAGSVVYVCLQGLLLQGATIDGEYLSAIADSDALATFNMPDVYIAWMPHSAVNDSKANISSSKAITVPVPLYSNLSKDLQLCDLKMKCVSEVDVARFVLSGSALFLENQR